MELNEALDVVKQLEVMYAPAKSLSADTLFLEALKEEIDLYRKENRGQMGRVLFNINENGECVYENIVTNMPKEFMGMFVALNPEPTDNPIGLLKEQAGIIKSLQDSATPLQERMALTERLDRLAKDIKALGGEIEHYNNNSSLESKKHQLLDKLLNS